jgi:hypothetical protein
MKKTIKKIAEKYVTEKTFENSMANIAKSFARVDEALELHGKILQDILKELKNMHEENKYFRQSITDLYKNGSFCDRKISNLDIRVEKLELKSK